MDNEQQAVVEETEVVAQPTTEGDNAPEAELESLLNEYEQTSTPAQPAPSPAEPNTDLLNRVQELEQTIAQTQSQGDLQKLVDRVRGAHESFDPDFVEAWVDTQARKDPRLQKAWENRHSNPKGLEKVGDALNGKLGEMLKSAPDAQVTEDMEAVAQAVKGATKTAPEAPAVDEAAVRQMNDADFDAWVKSQPSG